MSTCISYAAQLDLDSEDSTSPADLTNQLNMVMIYIYSKVLFIVVQDCLKGAGRHAYKGDGHYPKYHLSALEIILQYMMKITFIMNHNNGS